MVKYSYLFCLAIFLLFSCEKKYSEATDNQNTTEETIPTESSSSIDKYNDATMQNEAAERHARALELIRTHSQKNAQPIYNELLREPTPKHYYRERRNESQECEFCGEQDECGDDCGCEGSCNLDDCSCLDRTETERKNNLYEEEE